MEFRNKIVDQIQRQLITLLRATFEETPNWRIVGPQVLVILDPLDLADVSSLPAVRKQLLDVIEYYYAETTHWPFVRRSILRFFGGSGLQGYLAQSQQVEKVVKA